MSEQSYLQIARAFRAKRAYAADSPLNVEAADTGEATVEGGESSRSAAAQPVSTGEISPRTECPSAPERGDEEAVRTMLEEMRPYLTRPLQRISDDGLLLLAKWNLHVAAERAIDARSVQQDDDTRSMRRVHSAKKAN